MISRRFFPSQQHHHLQFAGFLPSSIAISTFRFASSSSSKLKKSSSSSLSSTTHKFLDLCENCAADTKQLTTKPQLRIDLVNQFQKVVFDMSAMWEDETGPQQQHQQQPQLQKQQQQKLRLPSPGVLDILLSVCYESGFLRKDLQKTVPEIFHTPSVQFLDYLLNLEQSEDGLPSLAKSFSSESLVVLCEILAKAHEFCLIPKNTASISDEQVAGLVNEMASIILERNSFSSSASASSSATTNVSDRITLLVRTAASLSRIVVREGPLDVSTTLVRKFLHEIELTVQRCQSLSGDDKYKLPSKTALQLYLIICRTKAKSFPDFLRKISEASVPCILREKDVSLLVDALKGSISMWNFHPSFFSALIQRLTELANYEEEQERRQKIYLASQQQQQQQKDDDKTTSVEEGVEETDVGGDKNNKQTLKKNVYQVFFSGKHVYECCLCINMMSRRNPKSREFAELRQFSPNLRKFTKSLEKKSQQVNLSPGQAKIVVVALTKSGAKLTRDVLEATVGK